MNIESTIRDMSLSLVQAYARSHVVYDVIDRDLPLVDLNASGRLYVWSGASSSSIYPSAECNWLFRGHHDTLHLETGLRFDYEGELELTKRGITELGLSTSPLLERLYWIDNVGQQLYYYKHGYFPVNQLAFAISAWNDPYYNEGQHIHD